MVVIMGTPAFSNYLFFDHTLGSVRLIPDIYVILMQTKLKDCFTWFSLQFFSSLKTSIIY